MATPTFHEPFIENMAEGKINLGGTGLTAYLCAAANAPDATDEVLGDLTEISYTNCSSRVITVSSSSQTSGTYSLVLTDLTLTASGGTVGPFRYVGIYDDDATSDELICFYDYGSEITLQSGETFKYDFGATTITLTPS
jgi:hypothetical protein